MSFGINIHNDREGARGAERGRGGSGGRRGSGGGEACRHVALVMLVLLQMPNNVNTDIYSSHDAAALSPDPHVAGKGCGVALRKLLGRRRF